MSISGPGLPRIVFQPDAWPNPGIPDLSPSLDETLNLVRPLLDPQLSYSITLDAMPIPGPCQDHVQLQTLVRSKDR